MFTLQYWHAILWFLMGFAGTALASHRLYGHQLEVVRRVPFSEWFMTIFLGGGVTLLLSLNPWIRREKG
ncbi:MAG: hypothetical protein NTW60_04265 [Candidatus Wolfebacteria bacterium]|nr:hypothetical protein [Candidatus Wolfebacteria bacterium]